MRNMFRLISAGPTFFFSSWILMLFAGVVYKDVGNRPFAYTTSMIVTIGLWITIAPAAGAIARSSRSGRRKQKKTVEH